jgi:hypothetical protein
MKKQPKKTTAPGPITHYTIGKGISEIPMISIDFTRPDLTVEDLDRVLPKGTYTFERRIAFAEKWATKILQDACLPADPKAEVIYEKNGAKWRGTALSSFSVEEERVSDR